MTLALTTVTGTLIDGSTAPAGAVIQFAPTSDLTDLTGEHYISSAPVVAVPDEYTGQFTAELVATDNAGILPVGWLYTVTVTIGASSAYFTAGLPSSPSTVDITDLMPAGFTVRSGNAGVGPVSMPGIEYLPATGGTSTGPLTLEGSPPLIVPGATSGQILASDGSGNFTVQAAPSSNVIDGVTVSGSASSGKTIVASSSSAATWQTPAAGVDWINAVTAYGADPTGSAPSDTAINNALSAATSGQVVYLPAGTYKTTAPLTPPQGVVLLGASGGFAIPIGNYGVGGLPVSGTIIKPSSSFSGAAVILLTVAGAVQSGQQQILQISIDGSSLPSSTIHGIQGINGVAGVKIRDVLVYGGNGTMKGNALDVRPGSNASPDFWDVSHCHFSGAAGAGVNLNGLADSYFFAVESTGNTGSGWTITNGNNSRFVGCKGEGSGSNQGWYLTANSGFTGQMSFSNCTASSNHLDGFYLTGPGAGIYTFTGCRSNNDGAGGGSSAGLTVTGSFAGTVQLTGLATVPGGSSNPPNGLRISSASASAQILLANCAIWGYSTSVSNDSSAGTYRTNSSCVFMTGALASPTSSAPGLGIAAGGTSATTQQGAVNALTGTQSAGTYLRSNGTNASLTAIQAADLPAATSSTQGAMKLGAGGYCLVVAASGATADVKNSADYVCTGTGDQSTINTAIGALPGAGGTILLSAGTFNITGAINIAASNITLEGTGVSTKIQVTSGTNITEAISVSGTGTVEVKLRRFWINGTITDTSGDGILINTPWSTTDTQHTLEDLYITGCPNNGIHVATSADTRVMLFSRIHVKGCNGNGFYLAYPSCTDSVFTDCIADTVALNGFFVGGANCWFENCKAFYCGSGGTGNYGFYVVGYNNYFTGCQAQDNYNDGFFGDNTGDATYGSFGCTFVNCSGDANGQSASSSGLRGHGVQQWQVIGGLWMTRPYETSWTQTYGITWEDATAGPPGLRPSSKNSVTAALFRNNATGTIHDTSTGPNYAFGNTYDSGTPVSTLQGTIAPASLPAGTTSAQGALQLDGTAADILPAGAQNAGANGKAADSGHIHPDMFGGYLAMGTVIGQTMPLICASTQGAAASAGTLIMLRTEVPAGGTTTAANFWITTAGNTLANVYVAAVTTSGTIVAQTANRVADGALTTSGALWSPPWSSSYAAAAGIYYTAILIGSATTAPVFRSGGGLNATSINLGTSVASGTIRVATYSSGLSALPSSPLTMSSMVSAADAKWCAWT